MSSSLNLDPSSGFNFQEEEVEEDLEEENSGTSKVIYQQAEAKTEPNVIDDSFAALDDLPLNLYHDDAWITGNHHQHEFSLENPNGFDQSALDQSGGTISGYPQITYVDEPIYLAPSGPGTGTSTGGGTSQNHTSNQRTNSNDGRTGTNNGGTNSEMESEITGEFPFSHEEDIRDTEPDGHGGIFDQSDSHIEKKLTERELSDPTWNIFRLSKMEEKLRENENDLDMHLDCLLRLNLANQSRIEFFRNRIEIKLAKAKERKMILEGRLNMPSSNRKRKYEKPVLLHHFKNGYFCDGLGHIPVDIADAGCTKLSALKPFLPGESEPPKKWTKKEEKDLWEGVTQCKTKDVMTAVRKEVNREPDPGKKVELMKKKLGKIKKTSERDYYGNRGVKYNWDGISKVVMQEKRTPTECRLKWRNVVHPDIKRDAWTENEKLQLKRLVRKFGDAGTWAKIAEQIRGRTAIQCFTEYRKQQLDADKGRQWTAEEDQKLLDAYAYVQIDEGHGFSWNAIAHYVPGRTPTQCQHRYKKSADPTILKGAWSRNEDIALLKAVMQIGLDWSKIRDSNVVPGRTDLQLRDRYYNALSEKHIKGSWTRQEDNLLREGHQKYGHQWTMVSELVVKTRTDGQCLKRWGLLKEYKAKGKEIKYAKNHCTKREKVQKLRELISDSIDQEQKNRRLLQDNDLVVLGKPRDALHTIEKNQQRIKNLGEGNPSSGNDECNAIVEFCDQKDIEQVTRHERIQKEVIEWAGNEDEKAAPKTDSLKELSKQCSRMYKPARAVQNQRYFKSRQETLDKKLQVNDSLYRRHLRQLLEATDEKLKKFHEGNNVYLPLAPHTVGLAGALFEEFGHERKKLEEIRGPIVEENEIGIKEESGELDRTLQSLLLWTFSQTNKYPGMRHVPRCQKVIKELSIGNKQMEQMAQNPDEEDVGMIIIQPAES